MEQANVKHFYVKTWTDYFKIVGLISDQLFQH